ncbi:hypothetical protein [Lysinibacillus sp. JNUCC 51]|uniref:hypothetical protein n=1 Tax=Lysinibacillus sp. JNUCC-51 TaxID=2792479 RepID=UPI001934C083|nr:hypothetical protein JNUCC51_08180 [Lysinibacillus sp. JNUCC-51]
MRRAEEYSRKGREYSRERSKYSRKESKYPLEAEISLEDRTFKQERFEKLGTVPVDESCFCYIIYLNDLSV